MKKAIAVLLAMLMVMPFAFATRISVYGDVSLSSGNAVVGDRGYIDISNYGNPQPDVFVCATKSGTQISYGMNLQSDTQIGIATSLIRQLAEMSFAGFDSYGCLRARV